MIDVKDLMIGNYVINEKSIFQLRLTDGCELVWHFVGSKNFRFTAKQAKGKMKPIPITHKWLDRLGLEEDDHYDYCRWLTSNYQVVVETSPSGTGVCILDEHSDYAFVHDIEYVHQLQNLIYNLNRARISIGGGV